MTEHLDLELPESLWNSIDASLPVKSNNARRKTYVLMFLLFLLPALYFTSDVLMVKNPTTGVVSSDDQQNLPMGRMESTSQNSPPARGGGLIIQEENTSNTSNHSNLNSTINSDQPGRIDQLNNSWQKSRSPLQTDGANKNRNEDYLSTQKGNPEHIGNRNDQSISQISLPAIQDQILLQLPGAPMSTRSTILPAQIPFEWSKVNLAGTNKQFSVKRRDFQGPAKYWTLKAGTGYRSSDYLVKGTFTLDANTKFSIFNQWSWIGQIEASHYFGKNFSLDFGIQYSSLKTRAGYEFSIPYSSAEETVDQSVARRLISHSIPSINGGYAAETLLNRQVENMLQEGEIIPLTAQVDQKLEIFSLPVSTTLRILRRSNFQVGVKTGINLNLKIQDLKTKVGQINSLHSEVNYTSFELRPSSTTSGNNLFIGYHFGGDVRYFVGSKGLFLNAAFSYYNAFTPSFSFDDVDVYPRSWGLELSVGKKI